MCLHVCHFIEWTEGRHLFVMKSRFQQNERSEDLVIASYIIVLKVCTFMCVVHSEKIKIKLIPPLFVLIKKRYAGGVGDPPGRKNG